jgi:hypothetical protein
MYFVELHKADIEEYFKLIKELFDGKLAVYAALTKQFRLEVPGIASVFRRGGENGFVFKVKGNIYLIDEQRTFMPGDLLLLETDGEYGRPQITTALDGGFEIFRLQKE